MRHPIQQVINVNGVHRFRPNKIVCYLLVQAPEDMNALARKDFSEEDWEQFAQLIGYSVSGFCDLGYASDEVAEKGLSRSAKLAKEIEDAAELEKYAAEANNLKSAL